MAMEDGAVFQNSVEMKKIADEIGNDSEELKRLIDEMYSVLEENLGTDDDGKKAWFGPKATQFLDNIKAKRNDFDTQSNNVQKISKNLRDQAEAWERFEQ